MTPERWCQIKSVFDDLTERPPEERESWLRERCGADEDLRREVLSLIESDRDAGSGFLDSPLLDGDSGGSLASHSLGAYRLLRRIGRGGMGSVYLAVREDDQFRRRVAVKAVRPELVGKSAMRRFRNERQTLAALDHPGIVKLLDWGLGDEEVPYLVMEYVEGERIDRFCDERKLPLAERLRLFQAVCAAVHYAHQNLVVHRDLKPTNILVTPEGVPKLLDFGIAKLLKAEYASQTVGLTRTEMQPMTPEYASPEQILGRPITTATDVYSLGVLLYRLLAGQHPFQEKTESVHELETAVCDASPRRPSSVAASNPSWPFAGDLDNIVLMAMRKEPQRRYPSVEHLSEDIRRYLENRPVMACRDTLAYRFSKLLRRHLVAVATSAGAAMLLVAATVLSMWYAGQARFEKERAERRLQDVRRLAEFILYDFDDALQSGPTGARKEAVGRGLEALNRLAAESPDAALQRDLIEGYIRIGDVQGNLYSSNLGDLAAAKENYSRAADIAGALGRANPNDRRTQRDLARVKQKLGDILALQGDFPAALAQYDAQLKLLETMPHDADPQTLRDLTAAYGKKAFTRYEAGELAASMADYRQHLMLAEQLVRLQPDNIENRRSFAKGSLRAGEVHASCGDTQTAEETIRKGLAVLEDLAASAPANALARRDLASGRIILGDVLAGAGRRAEAIAEYRKGVELTEALHRGDPRNKLYQRDLYLASGFLSIALADSGRNQEAAALMQGALALAGALADQPHASQDDHRNYAWLLLEAREPALKDPARARLHAEKASAMTDGRNPAVLHTLALAYHATGALTQAILTEEKALALVPPARDGRCIPHLWKELDRTLARFRAVSASGPAPAKD